MDGNNVSGGGDELKSEKKEEEKEEKAKDICNVMFTAFY